MSLLIGGQGDLNHGAVKLLLIRNRNSKPNAVIVRLRRREGGCEDPKWLQDRRTQE